MKLRPFFQTLQESVQTVYKHLATKRVPSPPSNQQLWIEARAASLGWQREQTAQQEASYDEVQPWVTSVPETPVEKAVKYTLMHILDEPEDVGVWPTQMLPSIQTSMQFKRTVNTRELTRQQLTDSLRRVNTTDPFLPSTRMTPNHEFAIVKPRSTAQLPPHTRLHEDIADAPEHVTPVDVLINRAIVTFHQEHQRLPHGITVNMIRFAQHWINNPRHRHIFFYPTEYGDVEIAIQPAAAGELLTDEVRLD